MQIKRLNTTTSTANNNTTTTTTIIIIIIIIIIKVGLPHEESIIVPIHNKGDTIDCNNHIGISLLPTSDKTQK